MNKQELISKISGDTTLTKTDIGKFLDAMLNTIKTACNGGEKVTLVGFGSFSVYDRKERQGRNPKTGEPITIPACKVPKFSAGKGFKEVINS